MLHTGLSSIHLKSNKLRKYFKWNGEEHLWTAIHQGNGNGSVIISVAKNEALQPLLVSSKMAAHYICQKMKPKTEVAEVISMNAITNHQSHFQLIDSGNSCSRTIRYPKLRCLLKCFQSKNCLRISVHVDGRCSLHMDVNGVPEVSQAGADMFSLDLVRDM